MAVVAVVLLLVVISSVLLAAFFGPGRKRSSSEECDISSCKSQISRKGRFIRYDFCLRLSHAIFIARAGSRHGKIVYNFHAIKLPVATIVVEF